MKRLFILLLLLACASVHAQTRSLAAPPQTAFEQRLNARLPLQLTLSDDDGSRIRLDRFFHRRPVVMVFGYYRCLNLCSTVMEGILQTFAALNLPETDYALLAVSIDPSETTAQAAAKKLLYRRLFDKADMHLLTGDAEATRALADAAGFQYVYDAASKQYVHPSGFLIATPDGVISRYFLGVRFDRDEVALALHQAASGRIGSLTERLLLLCVHYDPAIGTYGGIVMNVIRVLCIAMALALFGWIALRCKGRWR